MTEGYATHAFTQTLHSGRNAVLLAAPPPNGSLEVKSEVTASRGYAPVTLVFSVELNRSC